MARCKITDSMPLTQFPKAFSNSLYKGFTTPLGPVSFGWSTGNGENMYFLTEQASDTASSLAIHTTNLAWDHSLSLGLLSQIIFKLKIETTEGIDESVFYCLITPGLVPSPTTCLESWDTQHWASQTSSRESICNMGITVALHRTRVKWFTKFSQL